MNEIAQKYNQHGFATLPTQKDKSPGIGKDWRKGITNWSLYQNSFGIGIICGYVSRNLECLDFDNHFHDAKKLLTEFLAIDEVKEIYEKHQLPIEKTISGGYHVVFRCEKIQGNQKLAQRPKWDDKLKRWKPDTIIETRGEGGYFCCDPTPGYKIIRNDIFKVPTISIEERNIILSSCRSFNEWAEPKKNEYENTDRPGDLYNQDKLSIDEAKSLLLSSNWHETKPGHWCRPGKKKGISATFGKVADNVFYVFSSNAFPFEPMAAYTPFQVLALIKYNGDFQACAKDLSEKYKPNQHLIEKPTKKQIPKNKLHDLLQGCYVDLEKTIEQPPIIFSIDEAEATRFNRKRVLTLGNFSAITGKAKSKKTFFLSMVTATMVKNGSLFSKFYSTLPAKKRQVVYFDTEQSVYDVHILGKRIEKLSGIKTEHFGLFSLRPFSPLERCQIIEHAFTTFKDLGFVVIDGVADLANAINDEDEATRVITLLLRLTKEYDCHIATVIHQNKNDNFATGHIGSSIIKKAEMVIGVTKSKNNPLQSIVSCENARGTSEFKDFKFELVEGLPEILEVSNNDSNEETLNF